MSGADPQSDPNITQSEIDAALAAGGVSPAGQPAAEPTSTAEGSSAGADAVAVGSLGPAAAPQVVAMDLPDFNTPPAAASDSPIDLLSDVELNVKIELGRTEMLIEDVLRLGQGSVVELDKLAGDPVDVLVNDRLVARGEILVLNDNFCVRISEIIPHGAEAIPA